MDEQEKDYEMRFDSVEVATLRKYGASLNPQDDYALVVASGQGYPGIVKFLLENGANIHALHEQALRTASLAGHLEIVMYLVEHGADIHAEDDLALIGASRRGHFQICDYLVSLGADPQKVIDDDASFASEESKQWAKDFIKARDLANKLNNDLAEKSSKADRLIASIDQDAPPPQKRSTSTRQKI